MMELVIQLSVLILSVVVHEVAHGLVAYRYGDPTARNAGRLTLNPIKHLDILGSFIVPGILYLSNAGMMFGWAKPVPVQPAFFKHPEHGMRMVALAGPVSNLTLAAIAGAGIQLLMNNPSFAGANGQLLFYMFLVTIYINVLLAVFNMLPIPPLDGSRVLVAFLPQSLKKYMYRLEPYGFAIVAALIYFGVISKLIMPVSKILVAFFVGRPV